MYLVCTSIYHVCTSGPWLRSRRRYVQVHTKYIRVLTEDVLSTAMPQAMPLVQVHTKYMLVQLQYKLSTYILVCTEYVLSTYSVKGYALCISRLLRRSDVTVLRLCLLQSTNSVHTWYGTVPPPPLPPMFMYVCTWLYLKFQLCCVQDTILVIPPYPYCIEEVNDNVQLEDCWYAHPQLFFTWYILICTALKVVQIQMYWVPNWNVEFSWIVTCIARRYVPLQTSTSGFVRYLSMYHCCTVPTEYVLVCTCNFKTFTSVYQYVLGTYSEKPKNECA